MKRILAAILELLFPRRAVCMGCGSMLGCERDDVCEDCRSRMAADWIGLRAVPAKSGIDGAAFVCPYRGPGGSLVRNLKYGRVWILAEYMGTEMARAVDLLRLDAVDAVTAVPMPPKRLKKRGKNQAELLARVVAGRMGWSYQALIVRTHNARQQARLKAAARRKNLHGDFAAVARLDGQTILVIDDVYTTGSTARECALALKKAGAGRVYFAAFAYSEHGMGDEKWKKSPVPKTR